jgi:antirestriction protein
MEQAAKDLEPRIYVACLASYNDGILHGAWVSAAQDEEDVAHEVQTMLGASPIAGAEEYAIHDHEGFCGLEVGEYMALAEVVELAGFLKEHGALGAAVVRVCGDDLDEAREALTNRYHGVFTSLAECFEALTEETTEITANLRPYIDWEKMAADAELSGDIFTIKTAHDEVHVFWSR